MGGGREALVRVAAPKYGAVVASTRVDKGKTSELAISTARGERATFAASAGGSVSSADGRAVARIAGGSFRRANGTPYTDAVNLDLTVLDKPERMRAAPVGMRTAQGQLETFGVVNVRATTSNEEELESTAQVEVEITPVAGSGLAVGSSVDVYQLDATQGTWTKSTSTNVAAERTTVRGTLGWIALARVLRAGCVRGAVAGASTQLGVSAVGANYLGVSTATAGSDGTFCVGGRVSSDVAIDIGERWSYRLTLPAQEGTCGNPSSCTDVGVISASVTPACDVAKCPAPATGTACCTSLAGMCGVDTGYGCGRSAPFTSVTLPGDINVDPGKPEMDAGIGPIGTSDAGKNEGPDARVTIDPRDGTAGSSCNVDFSMGGRSNCNEGLSCLPNNFALGGAGPEPICPHNGTGCCMPTGKAGQRCGFSGGFNAVGMCDPGLACSFPDDPAKAACGGLSYCCVQAGGLDQPCAAQNTCNAGLSCVAPATDAEKASCGDSYCCRPTGGANQRCNANNTCNAGLKCEYAAGGSACAGLGSSCCLPTGGEGQACRDEGYPCDGDLQCVYAASSPSSTNSICNGLNRCCTKVGTENAACDQTRTTYPQGCAPGLVCTRSDNSSTPACANGLIECCRLPGAAGAPCGANAACNAGLSCIRDDFNGDPAQSTLCGGLSTCCGTGGTLNQPCISLDGTRYSDPVCSAAGLVCGQSFQNSCGSQRSCCQVGGGAYQPCAYYGAQCQGGLSCKQAANATICAGRTECCQP